MRNWLYEISKRGIDITASALGLIALFPIIGLIAIGVKLGSPGPVFYRGVRTGRFGVPFRILKFRTMTQDAERTGGGTTALHDSRITKIGQFLRRWKLDEIPQLANVLIGEMSLVGPRPELERYTAAYTPEEREILSVRPGITDFSSIHFRSLDHVVGAQDADEMFERVVLQEKNGLRLRYVRERSCLVDLRILADTFRVVLFPAKVRS